MTGIHAVPYCLAVGVGGGGAVRFMSTIGWHFFSRWLVSSISPIKRNNYARYGSAYRNIPQ